MKKSLKETFFLIVYLISIILLTILHDSSAVLTPTSCFGQNYTNEEEDLKQCQFPFTIRSKTYYSCTFDYSSITDYQPWCSTMVDDKGDHVKGNVGICLDVENCPIPPRFCGQPYISQRGITDENFGDEVVQQPWIVSLGVYESRNSWKHLCGGSLITSTHILTAARCLTSFNEDLSGQEFLMRLGLTDLSKPSNQGIERRVKSVIIHPNFLKKPSTYFDVGLAIAENHIEFTRTVRPICLPMRPVDDLDYLANDLVSLATFGIKPDSKKKKPALKFVNLRVLTTDQCEKVLSKEKFEDLKIPSLRRENIPEGIKRQITCVELPFRDKTTICEENTGSPVVRKFEKTARGAEFFEQHFLVSTSLNCSFDTTIYVRLTDRKILTWIQQASETMPLIMVVGGYNEEYSVTGIGPLNDVELLSSIPNNTCTRFARPLPSRAIELPNGYGGNEAEIVGLTGQFTKNAAIVCGGKNVENNLNLCYEFDPEKNQWDKIPLMNQRRYMAAAVVDANDNLWMIGGTHDSKGANFTEYYDYKAKGKGTWRKSRPIPEELRDSGISSHCVVRLNSTHLFMAGGFAQSFELKKQFSATEKSPALENNDLTPDAGIGPRKESQSFSSRTGRGKREETGPSNSTDSEEDYDDDLEGFSNSTDGEHGTIFEFESQQRESAGGGLELNLAWIFDGYAWTRVQNMFEVRDNPACSLVQLENETLRVLVAGGCNGWCINTPGRKTAELYDIDSNTWRKVADLPVTISGAKMEVLDGLPTIVGGYISDTKELNGDLYQYHIDKNEWIPHPTLTMRFPRTNPAVFQVPRSLFRYC